MSESAIATPDTIAAAMQVMRAPRGSVMLIATIDDAGGVETRHRVRDISAGGVRIDNAAGLRSGATVTISVGAVVAMTAEVRWARDGLAGIAFDQPIDPAEARKKAPSTPPKVKTAAPPSIKGDPVVTSPAASVGWISNMWDPYHR